MYVKKVYHATEVFRFFTCSFLTTKDRMNRTANVIRQTEVPMIFCLLKRKAIKIPLNDKIANIVVYGNHLT